MDDKDAQWREWRERLRNAYGPPRWTYTDPASRSAFVDFSQYDQKPMCFDNRGNMVPCDEDVIETTGRVVDERKDEDGTILPARRD